MRAEHGTYNDATGEVEATGRVVFDGGPHDAHITASHATYNVKSETGIFYDVSGTFGAVVRGQTVVLTTSNPFVIAGTRGAQGGAQPLHRPARQHHLLRRAGPDLDVQRGEDRPGGGRRRQALSLQLPPAEAADLLLSLYQAAGQRDGPHQRIPAARDRAILHQGIHSGRLGLLGDQPLQRHYARGAVLLLARLEPDGADSA